MKSKILGIMLIVLLLVGTASAGFQEKTGTKDDINVGLKRSLGNQLKIMVADITDPIPVIGDIVHNWVYGSDVETTNTGKGQVQSWSKGQ